MNRLTLLCVAALLCAQPCRPGDPPQADPPNQDLNALSIEQLMHVQVVGAALHPQTLAEAPASVTVITAEEIRKYGYRTLAEALASVRGFYVNNDRTYETVGVRGFAFPGDYASHVLVMVNGHNVADNIFDDMFYVENDTPIDMNLIKQIEIIRGPSSALYGDNAMFATVNIITKSPDEAGPLSLIADIGSYGEKKGQILESATLGDVKILLSGSVYNITGQSPLYFSAFNNPQNNYGNAIDMAGEKGYHFFSTLDWRRWTVTAAFSGDSKIQPISWGPTIFNDRASRNNDERGFVDVNYQREIAGGALFWRAYYDSYFYKGRADYLLGDGAVEDNRQSEFGNWVGSKLTYRIRPFFAGDITVGMEGSVDLRARLMDADVSPFPVTYLNASHPDRSLAVLFQDEKKLSERWKVDLGVRVDKSAYRRDFVSPRAALIYQHSDWTYKFLYGRSFRNPSTFQLFYADGIADAANPALRPESADTVEVDIERKLGKRMNLQASAYGYRLHDFILGVYLPDGLLQFQNVDAIQAEGIEVEINGRPTDWLEATASYAVQRSHDTTGILENSPNHLAKLHFALPLGRKIDVSGGLRYESSRVTIAENTLKPFFLADFTLTTNNLLPNFDLRVGLRNAFNEKYSDPIALNPVVDTMPEAGRTFFVELIAHRKRSSVPR